jgi:hypothetical protein
MKIMGTSMALMRTEEIKSWVLSTVSTFSVVIVTALAKN